MRKPLSIAAAAAAAILLAATPLRAQDAQSAVWDASISGDTVALVKALDDGAKIDSLDVRRSENGRHVAVTPRSVAQLTSMPTSVRSSTMLSISAVRSTRSVRSEMESSRARARVASVR